MPVHYYDFEDNLNDQVGTQNGTHSDTPTYSTDVDASLSHSTKSLDFNGSQSVNIADDVIPSTGNYTISFWLSADTLNGTAFDAGAGDKYFFSGFDADDIRWFKESNNDEDKQTTGVVSISASTWYHVAVVGKWNAAANLSNIYFDGTIPTYSLNRNDPLNFKPTALTTFRLGSTSGISNPFADLDGRLDDVAIWHEELSSTDIQSLADGANPVPEPSALLLAALGLLGLLAWGWRRGKPWRPKAVPVPVTKTNIQSESGNKTREYDYKDSVFFDGQL